MLLLLARFLLVFLHALCLCGRDAPVDQGVVAQDVEQRHDGLALLAQRVHGEFAAPAEHAFGARGAHGVDHVAREPERHDFRHGQHPPGFEAHAQVNVHDLARLLVEQDVVAVAVAET